MRFLTWMQELKTFANTESVDAVFAIVVRVIVAIEPDVVAG